MAPHIDNVRSSSIPAVDKQTLYSQCRGGDLVFCWGAEPISKAIECVAGGPSHVLMIWVPPWSTQWLTLESTAQRGVHVGKFEDYVDGYNGDLVLCRRPSLTQPQIFEQLNIGFSLLDDRYDFIEEASIAVRKLGILSKLPAIKPKNQLYCSGLIQAISVSTVPYKTYGPDWNTPEQNFIDPSVETVCAKLKS